MDKRRSADRFKTFVLVAVVVSTGVFLYLARHRLAGIAAALTRPTVPAAVPVSAFEPSSATSAEPIDAAPVETPTTAPTKSAVVKPAVAAPSPKPIPTDLNLAVPFTTQAPFANWVQPYEDGCEEASSAMIHYYYAKKTFVSKSAADAELKTLFAWEDEVFGTNKDANSEQVARMLREHYGYKKVEVLYDVTADGIRAEIAAGRPVIIPAYGKALGNPNFKNGGPVYHMLVIKGYLGTGKFVTNDPGTRNGADYIYSVTTIMGAVHDWNGGDVPNGRRAMIVVWPN